MSDIVGKGLSIILYIFIGIELFVNIPMNYGLGWNKDKIIGNGLPLAIILGILIGYFYPINWIYAFILLIILVIISNIYYKPNFIKNKYN